MDRRVCAQFSAQNAGSHLLGSEVKLQVKRLKMLFLSGI